MSSTEIKASPLDHFDHYQKIRTAHLSFRYPEKYIFIQTSMGSLGSAHRHRVLGHRSAMTATDMTSVKWISRCVKLQANSMHQPEIMLRS